MLIKADQLLCTISGRRKKVGMMIIIVMVMLMIASKKITSMMVGMTMIIQVASVLEGSASKSDWAAIRRCSVMVMTVEIRMEMMMRMLMTWMLLLMTMFRDSTSVSESTGGLASNDSLDHLRSSAEPVCTS